MFTLPPNYMEDHSLFFSLVSRTVCALSTVGLSG